MAHVEGLDRVKKALDRMKSKYAAGVERGLKKAGLFLQARSQEVVPVDTGALKNSATTRAEGRGTKTIVTVGYQQSYGVYVHENLEAAHKPGKIAKFLTTPMHQHAHEIANIVREEAKKK